MFDDWAWKSYGRVINEARKEPSPFKSKIQKKYKQMRYDNDIYSTKSGHKNPRTGKPFTTKVRRAGTDRLRFENLQELLSSDEGLDFSSLEMRDSLSPDIWDGDKLKIEVEDQLKKIANDFLTSMEIDVDTEDVLLVGSMAGYNWSKYSDIDLHIVLDFGSLSQDKELLEKYFKLAKSKWNRLYTIKLYGHDVELYVEDTENQRIPSSVYSVLRGEWLNRLDPQEPSIDYEGVSKKVSEKVEEIDELQTLYESGEYRDAFELGKKLREKIGNFRQGGLEREGEFSNENLAFKLLRRTGELDRMNEYVKKSYIEMRSKPGGGE
jgi:predicted nucleotidyltransferase